MNEKKKRLQLEEAETKKNELVQRLSFIASTKSKLEKELRAEPFLIIIDAVFFIVEVG